MKCVICKSLHIEMKTVEEVIRWGSNILLIPMEVLVCLSCGERYYDKKAMKKIEETRYRLQKRDLKLDEVGKVLKEHVA
ncbi:MAG: YgiT-type zinc finger protein [Candidatus Bathyarchaeota archaeon]